MREGSPGIAWTVGHGGEPQKNVTTRLSQGDERLTTAQSLECAGRGTREEEPALRKSDGSPWRGPPESLAENELRVALVTLTAITTCRALSASRTPRRVLYGEGRGIRGAPGTC